MRFDTLPDKLIKDALWCVWKYEDRDGKRTKVPYNPRTGGRAQSNNPATFSDFKTAVAAFGRCQYDGMGIGVFPPFAAIDIDHCVEDGKLSPLASDIETHSKSYTEYSPSGKGVRIILTVPDGFKYDKARYYINNQKKGLEVYVSGSTQKFVTITGNKISGDTIQDGESPLRYVCDKYMERATQKPKTKPQRKPATHRATMTGDYWLDMGMKKDPCLSDYWNGKFPMENESEKDAALMSRLLYWCNADVSRAIDLFKQSPFAMSKDEQHRRKMERDDYLQITANSPTVMPRTTAQEDNEAYQRRYIRYDTRPATNDLQERLAQMQPITAYTWDDKGMGELFADIYRDYCRYNVTAKEWYVYDGTISTNNWANRYILIPDDRTKVFRTDYRMIPPEWLGEAFLLEAERLQQINEQAYRHEYLGEAVGSGGEVFPNVVTRTITDEEIERMQYVYCGLDWGFSVDPFAFIRLSYDRKTDTIFLLDELYQKNCSNARIAEMIKEKGYHLTGQTTPGGIMYSSYPEQQTIFADAAEPKSIADLRGAGLKIYPCKKYPGSVIYGIRWLQNRKIVIDPKRTPHAWKEFTEYEYLTTKDGEFLADVPDENNHILDACRYALDRLINNRGVSA